VCDDPERLESEGEQMPCCRHGARTDFKIGGRDHVRNLALMGGFDAGHLVLREWVTRTSRERKWRTVRRLIGLVSLRVVRVSLKGWTDAGAFFILGILAFVVGGCRRDVTPDGVHGLSRDYRKKGYLDDPSRWPVAWAS
jgi:hypothetical protein